MSRGNLPRVVIDLERSKSPYCGLGQFALHFGREIVEVTAGSFQPTLLLPPGSTQDFGNGYEVLNARPWMKLSAFPSCHRWLRAVAYPREIAVWHATHQCTKYWPADPHTPVVLTLHDLNFLREKTPAKIQRRLRQLQQNVDRATLIVTGSHFAETEIREHLDLRDKPLHVIHNGAVEVNTEPQRPAFSIGKRFLFTIGELSAKKNFHVLIDMLQQLPDFQLVTAGKSETTYGRSLIRAVRKAQLEDRIFVPGKVTDAEREWLYQNCTAFVFPSISEGFGLPVVEAMRRGRPVFAARRTSLPEVGGRLAFYWDHFDPQYMATVLNEGLQTAQADPSYSAQLQSHARQFRWQRTAFAYLDMYRTACAQHAARGDLSQRGSRQAA